MELHQRLEQILVRLRPAFSRETTFGWFVLLVWGVVLSSQAPAVTSYVNALGLTQGYYHQALNWFSSGAFSVDDLCYRWGRLLAEHCQSHRLNGQHVYVGDGIKVAKEGRKMPGVRGLHQESEDVNKPEWLRGHYFSALSLLLGAGQALFATPIIIKLHDGIELDDGADEAERPTLVDKMGILCVEHMLKGSYGILDAYYAAANLLQLFRANGLHLISRARMSTTAYASFCPRPGKIGPGRHRQWGSPIKLKELFAPLEQCQQAKVWLYGQSVKVHYQAFEFYWDSPKDLVLFVLTQLPCGKRIILLSSDINLTGQQVIEAYGWRFKIEVTFRSLLHLLGGFCYRFWAKSMKTAAKWPVNLSLADYDEPVQAQILGKVEACERFINLNAIVLGLLQILALEMPTVVWRQFHRWFRTLPKHGYPTEQIVRITLQNQPLRNLVNSRAGLLLTKFLRAKMEQSQDIDLLTLAA